MVLSVQTDFIAVGGNRHPAAADWDSQSGLVAFGADRNVALWNALVHLGASLIMDLPIVNEPQGQKSSKKSSRHMRLTVRPY